MDETPVSPTISLYTIIIVITFFLLVSSSSVSSLLLFFYVILICLPLNSRTCLMYASRIRGAVFQDIFSQLYDNVGCCKTK